MRNRNASVRKLQRGCPLYRNNRMGIFGQSLRTILVARSKPMSIPKQVPKPDRQEACEIAFLPTDERDDLEQFAREELGTGYEDLMRSVPTDFEEFAPK